MRVPLLMAGVVALVGCASKRPGTEQTYTPDGRVGYTVNCSSREFFGASVDSSWGACMREAGAICRHHGFTVLDRTQSSGALVYQGNATTTTTRSMLFACNDETKLKGYQKL